MSTEFQLAFPCPHMTMEEHVLLGSDRRSLPTRQPVAASGSVRIQVVSASEARRVRMGDNLVTDPEDSFYLPSSGLLSVAQITGAFSGPFSLNHCETTDLTITSSQETVTLTLPQRNSITAKQVVDAVTPLVDTIVAESIDSRLVFSDAATVGQSSRIKVSGTAAAPLGFEGQTGARGAVIFPPWKLITRQDTITNRYPQFLDRVKQTANFRVTYTVPVERCLRCGATFVENDYRFDIRGEPLLIENEDLLYQAALKILLTGRGSNPFHPFYGSQLKSRIGSKAVGFVTTLINEDVRTALLNMQKLQSGQAKAQPVSSKERLFQILSVNVTPHADDPTAFRVDVVVTNGSGQPISLKIVFTVPGAIALQGSNGLSLGLDTTGLTRDESRRLLG